MVNTQTEFGQLLSCTGETIVFTLLIFKLEYQYKENSLMTT